MRLFYRLGGHRRFWPQWIEIANRGLNDRDYGCRSGLWRRSRSCCSSPATGSAFFQQDQNGIALIRIQAAQLVFDVDTGLATQVDQILTFDVKLSRQGINTGFLLQAELLYSDLPQPPINRTKSQGDFILTGQESWEKSFLNPNQAETPFSRGYRIRFWTLRRLFSLRHFGFWDDATFRLLGSFVSLGCDRFSIGLERGGVLG